MKLTDILREVEGEEDGMQQVKVRYDLAVEPADLDKALAALNDTKNYGIYAQNMRDPQAIIKAFGPSIPAQKAGAAWKDWDSRSDDEKAFKLADIKKRVPEAWTKAEAEAEAGYEKWQDEGEFRLAPLDSKLYAIRSEEKEIQPEPTKRYNLYGDPM